MSAQEKTVQIDSFDAKFLDINTLSKLIYERKSFVIENVSDVSETVKRVEHEIEKRKLSWRVFFMVTIRNSGSGECSSNRCS